MCIIYLFFTLIYNFAHISGLLKNKTDMLMALISVFKKNYLDGKTVAMTTGLRELALRTCLARGCNRAVRISAGI